MPKNGVIIYMSRMQDLGILFHSLILLYKNYNNMVKYPVIIFHDDITDNVIQDFTRALFNHIGQTHSIIFERIEFKLPEWVSSDISLYNPPLHQFRLGYRHMCRWYSGEIYKHDRLKSYDWYMRMDSDSFLMSPVTYDLFEYMEDNKKVYGYISTLEKDEPFVVEGLWETTQDFIKDKNIVSKLPKKWEYEMFYTNFELVSINTIRSSLYMDYYDYLDKSGNIYYRRWGDAPIRWLGLNMIMNPSKFHAFDDFCYQHGSWVRNNQYVDHVSHNILPRPYKDWTFNK